MDEWVRIAWHVGGISLAEYQSLTMNERYELNRALNDLIKRADSPPPNKVR